MGERKPPRSERICRDPLRAVGGAAKSCAVVVVEGDGANVLDREDASSRRPPTSQKDTVRFPDAEAPLSFGLVKGLRGGSSTAVLLSDSSLFRLLSPAECEK